MISQTAEYALRAAVCLGVDAHRSLTTLELAALGHIPSGYLAKVMQSLSRAGLVHSQRGVHGGFTLARPPHELTLLEVINAVDPIARVRPCPCAGPGSTVPLCSLDTRIMEAVAVAEAHLQRCTISDLIQPPTNPVPTPVSLQVKAQTR